MTSTSALPTEIPLEKYREFAASIDKAGGAAFRDNPSLKAADPEIYALVKEEERRQREGLELIASENFTSRAVMDAVGSCLTNKYSEGLPKKRYYGGNEVIDKLESLCIARALAAFRLDPEAWGVNVQSYSGSTANFSLFTGMLEPNDRVMGLHLPDGGHLSHGFYRGQKAVNISAKYFQAMPYHVDAETGYIDYDDLERTAKRFCPKMIVVGGSAYPRDWDYKRIRGICDAVGAYMHVDMAHYSGLVASQCVKNPFEFADVVTTTTHKSLRATRAALIFYQRQYEKQVESAVFPGSQGGPHNHAIAGVAVQLREVATPEFREYSQQVVKNCRRLSDRLQENGYKIVTGGTDTHLILWDLRPLKLSGSRYSSLCDEVAITLNKNTVHGDKSAMRPGGVRIGTPALTSRGFAEADFDKVADFLHRTCQLALEIQNSIPDLKKLKDFKEAMASEAWQPKIAALRTEVVEFAREYFMPGRVLD